MVGPFVRARGWVSSSVVLGSLVWGAAGCCACRCNQVEPPSKETAATRPWEIVGPAVYLTILPTGAIYVDGKPVTLKDLPALLQEREVVTVIFCYVGPRPPNDLQALIVTTAHAAVHPAMGDEDIPWPGDVSASAER